MDNNHNNMSIRLATASDLEAMTRVLIGASPLDPVYPYRFPDRHLYPSEFSALCKQKCAEYLATSTVVVCEMPMITSDHNSNPSPPRVVVAFASWDTPDSRLRPRSGEIEPLPSSLLTSPMPSSVPLPITIGHKDRMAAFRLTCAKYKSLLFDAAYPQQKGGHVMLKILLCHPDYQRLGAGTALTRWGIREAARLGLCTTVFASPMGLNLYKKLGFKEIDRFRIQLEGDSEYLEIPALVLKPKREAEIGSGSGIMHGQEVGGMYGSAGRETVAAWG